MYKLIFAILLSGCATIVSGQTQIVTVNTSPDDAVIEYRGRVYSSGEQIKVQKDTLRDITIQITRVGYHDQNYYLDKRIDMMWGVVGNIFCTSGIGIVIDVVTGAMMEIDERQVNVRLRKKHD